MPIGQVGRPGHFQRRRHCGLVVGRCLLVPLLVWEPSAADEVGDGESLWRHGILGEYPELACDLFGLGVVDVGTVEKHDALARVQQARHGTQQRRLAASVGADDRRDRGVGDLDVETLDDDAIVVADAESLADESAHTVAFRDIETMR